MKGEEEGEEEEEEEGEEEVLGEEEEEEEMKIEIGKNIVLLMIKKEEIKIEGEEL